MPLKSLLAKRSPTKSLWFQYRVQYLLLGVTNLCRIPKLYVTGHAVAPDKINQRKNNYIQGVEHTGRKWNSQEVGRDIGVEPIGSGTYQMGHIERDAWSGTQ